MIETLSGLAKARGLSDEHAWEVEALLSTAASVADRNARKVEYYEGDYTVEDIGVGKVPPTVAVNETCSWPRKAVTSVAERSRFEGFVFADGDEDRALAECVRRNGLVSAYNRNVASELVYGCMFATVNSVKGKASVRFHTARTAVGHWDCVEQRLESGLVVAETRRTAWSRTVPVPVRCNMHLPGKVVVFERDGMDSWTAKALDTPVDRPMMEAFSFRGDGDKPLGQSRITSKVMDIADDVTRALVYLAVCSAMYAAPLKYFLGLTDEQFEAFSKDSWSTYLGSMLLSTRDEEGNVPQVGQLPALSPQPYVEAVRFYAGEFAGETGVPMNSLGITTDNPASADAIAAAREDLCIAADDLNESNGRSLEALARMAMAVESNKSLDELTPAQNSVMARFKDTLRPSRAANADAAAKLAGSAEGFAGTNVFWEMQGFDAATVERVHSEIERNALKAVARQAAASAAPQLVLGDGR